MAKSYIEKKGKASSEKTFFSHRKSLCSIITKEYQDNYDSIFRKGKNKKS